MAIVLDDVTCHAVMAGLDPATHAADRPPAYSKPSFAQEDRDAG
jgi:hypothetical protein